MKHLKRSVYCVSILFILLASIVVFLFTTTPGLYTAIKVVNLFLPGKIKVHQGTGRLMNHFSVNEIIYLDNNVRVQITVGRVDWQLKTLLHHQLTTTLSADKVLVQVNDSSHFNLKMPKLPFNLRVNKLTINQIQVEHSSGNRYANNFELQASLNHQRWIIHSLKANTTRLKLNLIASGKTTSPYPLSATLQFTPLKSSSYGVQGHIKLDGDRTLYHWEGQFNGLLQGHFYGSLKNGVEIQTDATWHDATCPITPSYTLKSHQGNISIHGTFSDLMISANTHIDAPVAAQWQFTAHVKNKRTDITSSLLFPQSNLKTTITAKGTIYDAQHAQLSLSINSGHYQLPADSPIQVIQFNGGTLSVNMTPKELQAKGMLMMDQDKRINLVLTLPKFRLTEMTKKQPINGQLQVQINSLEFLQGLSKFIENVKGQLQMNLIAKGTLAKPIVSGELLLTNASLFVPKSGLTFGPIQAKLISHDKHWQAQGSITSLDQAITLKGQGDFFPQVTGQLNISGDNFTAIKNANYTINLSPHLAINFRPNALDVTGSIVVPSATLKPISFSNTVSLSDDAIFVSKTQTAANPLNMSTDVQLKMGPAVALDVKGLRGFLDGAIQIKQSPKSILNATGELTIRDGKYQAYGQDLIIDQGQLMFTGGLIDNPGIHIRAIRKFSATNTNLTQASQSLDFSAANIDTIDVGSQTTVGIEMSGHLNAHKIKLFSIPANLSQADILSMLLLGKPANQASKSGGQLLLAAISSMNLDSGTKGLQLLSQLKQTMGIDFNVQSNARYNQTTAQAGDNTTFVVSKSLTKRLFLSYNIGLLQNDSNVFTLKYLLNKFFSIQVNTSDTGSGIDLLYTHSKD